MTTDQPPLTRRQAREQERSQQNAPSPSPLSRRAVTTEPTPGGETPHLVTPFTGVIETVPAAVASAAPAAFDSVLSARPAMPNYASSGYGASALVGGQSPAVSTVTPPIADLRAPAVDAAPSFTVARTDAGASADAAFRPRGSAPAVPVETDSGIPERTLTRRELRAMLEADAAAVAAESATEVVVSTPAPMTDAIPTLSDTSRRATWTPPVLEEEARPVWEAPAPAPVAPAAPAAVAPAAVAPAAVAPVAPVIGGLAALDQSSRADDILPPKPLGHWSVDTDLDDGIELDGAVPQAFDQMLSRGGSAAAVSAGGVPTTTSALILPSIPNGGEASVALTTGEVLVTGSFDLPRSLGSTGAHPDRIDSSDIDKMFEMDDAAPGTGAQPIKASRVVSSHTPTRDVITPPTKESRWTIPFILSISAAVLAVGVVGLIVAGFVSGVF